MAAKLLVAVLLSSGVSSVEAEVDSCGNNDCSGEESSLLALNMHRGAVSINAAEQDALNKCKNRFGVKFPCGDGDCCGDICVAKGGTCCKNSVGNNFACAAGDSCCGDSCASAGSKCCKDDKGRQYPVSKDSLCSSDSVKCVNRNNVTFSCGPGSTCCGDVCVEEGGKCCKNDVGNNFPCGKGSTCCGNACAAKGSKCCRSASYPYPVSKDTKCAGSRLALKQEPSEAAPAAETPPPDVAETPPPDVAETPPPDVAETPPPDVAEDPTPDVGEGEEAATSVECTNDSGHSFTCGKGSTCCGNACAGKGSKCCTEARHPYPVSKDTKCAR